MNLKTLTLPLLAALTLTACATGKKLDAAGDVHSLLVSIRDNDHAAFDAHVDRPALQAQVQTLAMQRIGKSEKSRALAALLGPSVLQIAGDALIQPEVFRYVAEEYGYGPDKKIPPSFGIARMLKTLPDGRVCAVKKKDGPCFLIFTKEDGAWKLSGFEGDAADLRLKAASPL